jgi:hypothetical protein
LRRVVLLLAVAAFGSLAPSAGAKVFLSVDEALALAFPGCEIDRRTVYPTEEQLARAREIAGQEIPAGVVRPYVARCDGGYGGVAYFDTHRVRTLPETLMVVVDPGERVRRVEILSFQEPEDYIPRGPWYEQFLGEPLSEDLRLGRDIHGVTGATLTARATTEAVRRMLALHEVIRGELEK